MVLSLRNRRDIASLYLLYGLFVLLPFTVAFGHRGVAPWLLLAGFPAFLRGDFWQTAYGALFEKWDFRKPFFVGFTAIMFFSLWILLSGVWSPKHHYTLFSWVMAPVLVGGSVIWFALNLSVDWRFRLARAFAAAIACGMAVLAFEGLTDGLLRRVLPPADTSPGGVKDIIELGRGVTALAPSLFPAAIMLGYLRNRLWAAGLLLLGVLAAFTNDVSANAAAIAFGFAMAVMAFKATRIILPSLGALVIGSLVLCPLIFAMMPVPLIFSFAEAALSEQMVEGVSSWLHRLVVWQSAAREIPSALFFGHGADYARIWSETASMVDVPGVPVEVSTMPLHPHNIFLQIWLEFGLIGALSFGVFLYCGLRMLLDAQLEKSILAATVGTIGAIYVSMMVEGSLWQVWRLAAMAVAGMGLALSYSITQKRTGMVP